MRFFEIDGNHFPSSELGVWLETNILGPQKSGRSGAYSPSLPVAVAPACLRGRVHHILDILGVRLADTGRAADRVAGAFGARDV